MSFFQGGSSVPTTAAAISSQMVAAMGIIEPTLDLSVGQTMRKIIDVVAEQNAQTYSNAGLSSSLNDITTLSGAALDAYAARFGMTRFAAKYATGTATFDQAPAQGTTQNQPVTVVLGTQLTTISVQPVVFQTLVTFTMAPTDSSVTIPIQAVLAGSGGNVGANNITAVTVPLNGVSGVSNTAPTSGGTDAESDAAFISRFQRTVLRALTGTSPSFLGTALENNAVTAANVIGAFVTHSEQIQIGSGGTAVSSVDDAAFVFPYNVFMASNLSAASSTVNEGTVQLSSTLSSGTTYTSLSVATPVTLPAGALLAFGPQVATVSTAVNNSTTIPINSFAPSASYIGGSFNVNYLYNTGAFLSSGADFSISSVPLIANPGAGPLLAVAATTYAGEGFSSSFTAAYRIAYGDQYGITSASPESTVAVSGTSSALQQVTVSWGAPSGAAGELISQVFIFGRTVGAEQLLAVVPITTTSWIDLNVIVPQGALPTNNTSGLSVIVTSLNSSTVPDGALLQLQFDYIPFSSRNDYALGILNRVDLYVAGSAPTTATEALSFFSGASTAGAVTSNMPTFSGTPSSPFYVGLFQRLNGTFPQPGNFFIPLSYSPILSVPSTIISPATPGGGGAATYSNNVEYWGVNSVGSGGMSDVSFAGIEWDSAEPFGAVFSTQSPQAGAASLTVSYTYNAVPSQVHGAIQQWRLLSQDTMVHQATAVPLNFYLVAVLVPGASLSVIQAAMTSAIQSVLSSVSFNNYLEPSAIISAVQAVTGVQAVRFARSSDATSANAYAIAPLLPSGAVSTPYNSGGVVTAVNFSDTTYPTFNGLFVTQTAQNLFGAG